MNKKNKENIKRNSKNGLIFSMKNLEMTLALKIINMKLIPQEIKSKTQQDQDLRLNLNTGKRDLIISLL
jgi:hypothetical protein